MTTETSASAAPEVHRETLEMDVLFVGAGPANLAAAIHLQNLVATHNQTSAMKLEPQIAILEKGGAIGAHLLSGAVLDPKALAELVPDFKDRGCPIESEVLDESVMFLTEHTKFAFPIVPPPLQNHGNYIISLNKFGAWLGKLAEEKGVNIFTGFSGAKLLTEGKRVVGVQTDDKGLDKNSQPKPGFEAGMNITAKVTVLGEGPRGSLTKQIVKQFNLDADKNPQSYETGVKEIWEVPAGRIKQGTVYHTMNWPLPQDVYGGSWIYAMSDTMLSVGFVTALDATDPTSDPHFNMQKFKTHPFVRSLLEGGKMTGYGAKTISGGGYYSMPKLYADGLLLTGESGGFLNMQRLKGIHLSMKSGMLAAETIFEALVKNDFSEATLKNYETKFEASWAKTELFSVRNFRQVFNKGLLFGMVRAGLQIVFGGRLLKERLELKADHFHMSRLSRQHRAKYQAERETFKFDGKLTFDKLTDVFESKTMHEENQPNHLFITPEHIADVCNSRCVVEYGNPCQHFCPAKVYEMNVADEKTGAKKLHINASNCVHCKTCDIADPYQVITWKVPEGGGGPVYTNG
ncbi:MAG: electron transfer flavoprotein-ubiquinone oxidoreductase [Rhizobacter sp.]|nr:electron transfer flavoprotein-ubiquinone oxidoreductase [Chlorobiales bacterium]